MIQALSQEGATNTILRREQRDLAGEDWRDDNKFVIGAEYGGGMACTAVAGGLDYLVYTDRIKYIDAHGPMSGAIGAVAATQSNQMEDLRDIFTWLLAEKRFIKLSNYLLPGTAANYPYLTSLFRRVLNIEAVYNNPIPLCWPVTRMHGYRSIIHTKDSVPIDKFVDRVIDGTFMPRLGGRRARMDADVRELDRAEFIKKGRKLHRRDLKKLGHVADGGLATISTEDLAVKVAQMYAGDKQVEILGIAVKPKRELTPPDENFTRWVARWVNRQVIDNGKQLVWDAAFAQSQHLEDLLSGTYRGASIQVSHPQDIPKLADVITTDPASLMMSWDAGWNGMCALFGDTTNMKDLPERDPRPAKPSLLSMLGGNALNLAFKLIP